MHAKSDSEVTSNDTSSPRRRPFYYVQSPPNHGGEKLSYSSSPMASPHHYHHSREPSSSSRFSTTQNPPPAWRRIYLEVDKDNDDTDADADDDNQSSARQTRIYAMIRILCWLIVIFILLCFILYGVSKCYKPKITIQNIVFEGFVVKPPGENYTGAPTDLLNLSSTVQIVYQNPATFFGVHVFGTTELRCYELKIASGHIKFYQSRKSDRKVVADVNGMNVSLYGLSGSMGDKVPLNFTLTVRSTGYLVGKLVKTKFYRVIRCNVTYRKTSLGKRQDLMKHCFQS